MTTSVRLSNTSMFLALAACMLPTAVQSQEIIRRTAEVDGHPVTIWE